MILAIASCLGTTATTRNLYPISVAPTPTTILTTTTRGKMTIQTRTILAISDSHRRRRGGTTCRPQSRGPCLLRVACRQDL